VTRRGHRLASTAFVLVLALIPPLALGSPGAVVLVEHHDPTAMPSIGPIDAPVTIEVFFSPGPNGRVQTFRMLKKLQADHPSQIRLVYRVLVGGDARLPYAALEAFAQGTFVELMKQLNCEDVPVSMCRTRTTLPTSEILDLGAEIGMDRDRLATVMSNPPDSYQRALKDNDRRKQQRLRSPVLPAALFAGRAPRTPLTAMTANDLEREYEDAKQRADDLLERGADPRMLTDELDARADDVSDPVVQAGQTDEDFDQPAGPYPLASPPLAWTGLPSLGDPRAQLTIAVVCSPASGNCSQPLAAAVIARDKMPDRVRVVWAPMFDPHGDDAKQLAALSDATLCAEQVGTGDVSEVEFDRPASAGWRWLDAMFTLSRPPQRRPGQSPEPMIEKLVAKLHVDPVAFANCRLRIAGRALAWADGARKSGVHGHPATIIGGRIYPSITDSNTVQQLAVAELAPGVLREAVYWLGGLATVRAPRD
jgi:hypothetical protein